MFVKEQQKLKAIWRIQIRDAKTEKLIIERTIKNIVTDNGKNFIASVYVNPYSRENKTWRCVLGTGTGTPSATDTGLWSPVDSSEKGGQLTASGNIAQYWTRYLPEDANGYTYSEAGIYENCDPTASPVYKSGILLNHVVIDPAIKKTADILVDIYVQLQFA